MSWFLARIELHGPSAHAHLHALHVEMAKLKFSQVIPLSDGIKRHLLPGEYFFSDDTLLAENVKDLILQALKAAKIPASTASSFWVVQGTPKTFNYQNLDVV